MKNLTFSILILKIIGYYLCPFNDCISFQLSSSINCRCGSLNKKFTYTKNQNWKNIRINELTIQKSSSIPVGSFDELKIGNLTLKDSPDIINIQVDAFEGIQELFSLNFINLDNLAKIQPGAFIHLKHKTSVLTIKNSIKLKDISEINNLNLVFLLTISQTSVSSINFQNLNSLTLAYLNNNSIRTVSIIDCDSLRKLDLSSNTIFNLNNITTIPYLTSLDLSFNSISNLDDFLSSKFPSLTEIDFTGNKISKITLKNKLSKLSSLILSKNRLAKLIKQSLSGFQNCKNMDLSLNRISQISENSFKDFKNLIKLDLSGNLLNDTPPISNLNALEIINLSNQSNRLKKIRNYAFGKNNENAVRLQVNLRNNSIDTFSNLMLCSEKTYRIYVSKLMIDFGIETSRCVYNNLYSVLDDYVKKQAFGDTSVFIDITPCENDQRYKFYSVLNDNSNSLVCPSTQIAFLTDTVSTRINTKSKKATKLKKKTTKISFK
ncbi:unnamed protein product [Brachionus calyciflorus]|uniref:Uncharacterized protein n=1 Tax=Brachionus calyciflorus TaxID=104777 RepID=A0A814D8T1_9BILA|nr:unnamed protein product [Brachionus calyciflorus]